MMKRVLALGRGGSLVMERDRKWVIMKTQGPWRGTGEGHVRQANVGRPSVEPLRSEMNL